MNFLSGAFLIPKRHRRGCSVSCRNLSGFPHLGIPCCSGRQTLGPLLMFRTCANKGVCKFRGEPSEPLLGCVLLYLSRFDFIDCATAGFIERIGSCISTCTVVSCCLCDVLTTSCWKLLSELCREGGAGRPGMQPLGPLHMSRLSK